VGERAAASADGLERELSLLARHTMPGRRIWDPDRLERSAYNLLLRLEADLRRFNQCVEEVERRPWPRPES